MGDEAKAEVYMAEQLNEDVGGFAWRARADQREGAGGRCAEF